VLNGRVVVFDEKARIVMLRKDILGELVDKWVVRVVDDGKRSLEHLLQLYLGILGDSLARAESWV